MNVVIGVSGGIDSFFTTKLLKSLGYDVFMYTYKFWQYQKYYDVEPRIKSIADYLKLKYYICDSEDIFYKEIVSDFINEYFDGRTPNPCVKCNSEIKFKFLYDYSNEHNINFIATGHYANVKSLNNRYFISSGVDSTKDQSYFLWKLNQNILKKTILPLGQYFKKDIKSQIPPEERQLLDKRESNDICFLGNNSYKTFLLNNTPDTLKTIKKGTFIYENKVIGTHSGYYNFTIGQRKNLNVAIGIPLYVKKIDPKTNTVYLCKNEDIEQSEFNVKNINYQKYQSIQDGFECYVKIRYRSDKKKCKIYKKSDTIINVKLDEPVNAICPGQSAVFYEDDDVVLGGIITDSLQ